MISRFLKWYLHKHRLRNVGDVWQVDEKYVSVLGIGFWLLSIVDIETEFILVLKIIKSRTVSNLANALQEARLLVRKSPIVVETDALTGYRKAVRRVFGEICHWRAKKSSWYGINNLVENLNSVLQAWLCAHKGFHSLMTAQFIADGLWIQYNFVKRSTSQYLLHQTRAESAGFDIRLIKPWTELLILAEKAALLGHIPTVRHIEPAYLTIQTELDPWLSSPNLEQPLLVPETP
jgi:transposase-like protein